jgi:hypothetical protein
MGQIEFYGLRKLSEEKIRQVLRIKEGSSLPPSKAELEDRLEKVPGVVQARLEAVCCEDGKATLFVGIEEKGAPHFSLRSAPAGNALLPDDIVEAYRKLLEAVQDAARKGSTAEDLTQGHPLMAAPEARDLQERFVVEARQHLPLLRDVLRNSSDPEHRAMAAAIAGYAPDKRAIIDDLQYAMQDPDESVRANAMRALGAIAVLGTLKPDLGIRIPATWFVEMLNSIVLSDRNKAALALVNLTENRGEKALSQVRERALPALTEMARWKSLRYALPAFILLGRVSGLSEQEIQDAWSKDERERVISSTRDGSPIHRRP